MCQTEKKIVASISLYTSAAIPAQISAITAVILFTKFVCILFIFFDDIQVGLSGKLHDSVFSNLQCF